MLKRTNSDDPDFLLLVDLLDKELAIRDGEDHAFYHQFNQTSNIRHVVVVFENEAPVACGAFKHFDDNTVDIKRMFVKKEIRGRGIAVQVLDELERWAAELNYRRAILETGLNQPEAIRLYEKTGYQRIANFGQYAGVENSVCMEKVWEI